MNDEQILDIAEGLPNGHLLPESEFLEFARAVLAAAQPAPPAEMREHEERIRSYIQRALLPGDERNAAYDSLAWLVTAAAAQPGHEYRHEIAEEFRRAIPTEAGAVLAALIEEGVTALESHIRYACAAQPAPAAPEYNPEAAWHAYAVRSGLLNDHGVSPSPARTQDAYNGYTAGWNDASAAWRAVVLERSMPEAGQDKQDARDAARYRWLREQLRDKQTMLRAQALFWEFSSRRKFDAAIDEHLKGRP